jgi:hypothetical protein
MGKAVGMICSFSNGARLGGCDLAVGDADLDRSLLARGAVAGRRKTKFRGLDRVRFAFTLAAGAYNLVRLSRLLTA